MGLLVEQKAKRLRRERHQRSPVSSGRQRPSCRSQGRKSQARFRGKAYTDVTSRDFQ